MVGRTLAHYRILEKLGSGGMGEVYRAEDTKLGREVAVKVLRADFASDPDRWPRFEREARAVAALNHPNIVTIYSVEEDEDVHFLTMELVDGKPLSEVIPRGGLPLSRLFDLAVPLAEAISSAHDRSIVHRDLKPANIMVDTAGRLKVLDFGVSKLVEQTADGDADSPTVALRHVTHQTQEGRILGTAAYMSPEQAEGKPVDHRSDVFSLGIVLYEMATGEQPFRGDTVISTISSILKESPRKVTEVRHSLPRQLGRIIHRCIEKDPARRFQTARDVCNELEGLQKEIDSGELEAAPQPTIDRAPRSAGSRAPWVAALVIGAVIIAVGAWQVSHDTSREATVQSSVAPAATPPRAVTADGRKKIVVLPFENLGPAEQAYFAAGITDEITGRLAAVSGLGVISRTSATAYDRSGKSMNQVGTDLGVGYVLEGTVRWAPPMEGQGRVRITPHLVRVADDTQLWSETYDREMTDIFEVQSEIAGHVIDQLGVTLLGAEREVIEERPTENVEAYQFYLRAWEWDRSWTLSRIDRHVVKNLEQAVRLDPDFLEAWAGQANHHSLYYGEFWDRSEERLSRSKRALGRAVAINPTHPETLSARGYYAFRGFRESLELEPGSDGSERSGDEPDAPEGEPAATRRANQGRQVRSAG